MSEIREFSQANEVSSESPPIENLPLGIREGLAVRASAIGALTGSAISETIRCLGSGVAGLSVPGILTNETADAILSDLNQETDWSEECWLLDENTDVHRVSIAEFEAAPPNFRFSRNDCLRKPSSHSHNLRGFLSALVSDETREFLSSAFGEKVKFRSADIARYRNGHYLRRHSDTFEDRRFGFVWYFCSGWEPGMGGELIIESPAGVATVVHPTQGSIGALAFRKDCYHQVAHVCTTNWVRLSIASHFCADNGTAA